jgi:hypothetical protein
MSQYIERLTFVLLTSKNYHPWTRQVIFGLTCYDKLEYINSEKPASVVKKSGEPIEEKKRAHM